MIRRSLPSWMPGSAPARQMGRSPSCGLDGSARRTRISAPPSTPIWRRSWRSSTCASRSCQPSPPRRRPQDCRSKILPRRTASSRGSGRAPVRVTSRRNRSRRSSVRSSRRRARPRTPSSPRRARSARRSRPWTFRARRVPPSPRSPTPSSSVRATSLRTPISSRVSTARAWRSCSTSLSRRSPPVSRSRRP